MLRKLALSRGQIIIKMSITSSYSGVTIIANSFADYLHSWLYIAVKALENGREENGI